MKMFKKMILSLTLAIAMTVSYVPKSHAIVGICSWNPLLMGAGLAVATVGYVAAAGGAAGAQAAFDPEAHHNIAIKVLGVLSGAVGVVGVAAAWVGQIALPDGTTSMVFTPVTADMQKQLKLTNSEAKTYNDELDQVNFIATQVALDLAAIPKAKVEDSSRAWSQYEKMVSPLTYKVMGKIAGAMFQK